MHVLGELTKFGGSDYLLIEGETEMKRNTNLLTQITRIALSLALWASLASAQEVAMSQGRTSPLKTDSRMLYHNGPLLMGAQDVYIIWYGNWVGGGYTMPLVSDFVSVIGNSPYMSINSTYTDGNGNPAASAIVYGGSVVDSSYSHSSTLTDADIQAIIYNHLSNFDLPQDPNGIYVVIGSADISSLDVGFCGLSTPTPPPYHSHAMINGGNHQYIFLGHPDRCAPLAAPQFLAADGTRLPTPSGNFAADGIISNLARALDGAVTNPYGNGWFDRYGLENTEKCRNQFGPTYLTPNGARANVTIAGRDYLLQQNWVNSRKGYCATFP